MNIPLLIALMAAFVGPQTAPPRRDIPAIAKAANGAIVTIVMSDKDGHVIAQASGFLISKDGRIVTNYHVIEHGSSAIIKLPDGAFFVVDGVLAFDKARDVAVIKAHGENFRTLTLGNSDRLQVGEEVVAIGNPLSLESTVSNGIVSGIRTVEEEGGKFLQVTTPISPGSSGGPLFNMAGEVVGITTLKIKGGENLNFAIPINEAKHLLLTQSAKAQNFPNEPESVKAQTRGGAPSIPGDRSYYKQLVAAGEFNNLPFQYYVCFKNTLNPPEGLDAETAAAFNTTFYIFTAFALTNDDTQAFRNVPQMPYVTFLPSDLLEQFVNAQALAYLRQGGWYMQQTPYIRGVKMGVVNYVWDRNEQKWKHPVETEKNETSEVQLSIEPRTLRYIKYGVFTLTDEDGSVHTNVRLMDSGGCEEMPAKR
jgi:hypothetical protein